MGLLLEVRFHCLGIFSEFLSIISISRRDFIVILHGCLHMDHSYLVTLTLLCFEPLQVKAFYSLRLDSSCTVFTAIQLIALTPSTVVRLPN